MISLTQLIFIRLLLQKTKTKIKIKTSNSKYLTDILKYK